MLGKIVVFVNTTRDFICGERFVEYCAWLYLENLGYTDINIVAGTKIKGRKLDASEY